MTTRFRRSIIIPLLAGILTACTSPTCWAQGSKPISEDLKITPNDGAENDQFGRSIAFGNAIIAVGAPFDDDKGDGAGAAYFFDRNTGKQLFRLHPESGPYGGFFGRDLAIDNGLIVVGAIFVPKRNGEQPGAAYVFDTSTGKQIVKLRAEDGADRDTFGYAVDIDNGIVAVGSPGAAGNGNSSGAVYLFDAHTGQQLAKIFPDQGFTGVDVGHSVALENGIVAVGDPEADDPNEPFGRVYLFDADTGEQIRELIPSERSESGNFGAAIAMDNGIVAVGAPGSWTNGLPTGAIYLFDAISGQEITKFVPYDAQERDGVGLSVAISNGMVAAGVQRKDDNGIYSGAAYIFDLATEAQIAKLLPSDGFSGDSFGSSIAINQGAVAVGASHHDNRFLDDGAAYLFSADSYPPCINLAVENLVAGQSAIFKITNGTPAAKCITTFGFNSGQTSVFRYVGYCATFGIDAISQDNVFSGFNRKFNNSGKVTFRQFIPRNAAGLTVFLQSAERATCPDECTSNLVKTTIQ